MPIIKSAMKRMRQTATAHTRNQRTKRNLRTALKSFVTKPSQDAVSKAQSEIDKAVKKGLMKKNTASRKKAQIARDAKAAGVKVTAKAKKTAPTKVAAKPAATAKKAAAPKAAATKTAVAKKPAAKKPAAKKTEK
ncbi:MAG TPA: 30S ribosomal protein S20 [Candidatus Saccharimonadales bacterium]|nr:30S ribosomal protein S20 [Candidatus Saccharimonadales bacterium]